MSEQQTSTEQTSTDGQSPADSSHGTSPTHSQASEQTSDPKEVKDLPAWAQEIIREARDEAKSTRLKVRDLEDADRQRQAAEAEQQGEWEELAKVREGEITSLKQQLAERDARDLRSTVAKRHNLPDDLANRLTGETEDELDEDAKALATLIGPQAAPDTDAGERTPRSNRKQPEKKQSEYADPAYWGLGPPR